MKKRFKNILRKNRKKNGIFILILAVALTMGFGALMGCSIAKEDTRKEDTGTENRPGLPQETDILSFCLTMNGSRLVLIHGRLR